MILNTIKYQNSKNSSDITAILPAAGVGKRMGGSLPKQYYTIKNKTVIEYSINSLLSHTSIRRVIVVINRNDRWFHRLSISSDPRVSSVIGGETRADSVMAGLRYVKDSIWVIVHDAVRPCLHYDDLSRLLRIKEISQIGGILATPVYNTIKKTYINTNQIFYTLKRNCLWNALTPQLFNFNLLKYCLSRVLKYGISVTDESSAIEYFGYVSLIVRGREDNIKVTYWNDLILADFYLSSFLYRDRCNKNRN